MLRKDAGFALLGQGKGGKCGLDGGCVHGACAGSRVIERKYTNIAPENSATSSASSSHILARDGAPTPKHPQSSVRPRSSADANAVKNITEMTATASAPTRLVRGASSRTPHASSNGGRPSANRLMNTAGTIANAAVLSANCSGSRILSMPA